MQSQHSCQTSVFSNFIVYIKLSHVNIGNFRLISLSGLYVGNDRIYVHSYYGVLIGNHMHSIEPWHFQWSCDLWRSFWWPILCMRQGRPGSAGFLDLGDQFWKRPGRRTSPSGVRGRAPGGGLGAKPQKLKKRCKLYTFEKYFVCHTWCQGKHIDYCRSTQIYTKCRSTNIYRVY